MIEGRTARIHTIAGSRNRPTARNCDSKSINGYQGEPGIVAFGTRYTSSATGFEETHGITDGHDSQHKEELLALRSSRIPKVGGLTRPNPTDTMRYRMPGYWNK